MVGDIPEELRQDDPTKDIYIQLTSRPSKKDESDEELAARIPYPLTEKNVFHAPKEVSLNFEPAVKGFIDAAFEEMTDELNIINNEIENLLDVNYKDEKLRLVGVTLGNLKTLEESLIVTLFNVYDIYK